MAKERQYSEKELALMEAASAKEELERVMMLFNFADDQHFEIANQELTIAQMKYEICWKKIRLLFPMNEVNPQFNLFLSVSY